MSNNVYSYLDATAMHLPEGDSLVYTNHDFGWWVYVWSEDEGEGEEIVRDRAANFPALCAVVAHARSLGCRWINFDSDAEAVEGLPLFNETSEAEEFDSLLAERGVISPGPEPKKE